MSAGSDVATIPGWYGKLPSLGDFASRRLAADFIDPWDLWLGEGLQAQRDSFGERWLDAYLHSPPWRFLLAPGTMPGHAAGGAVAGVLLPSVDRVGRHFPLTIAATIDRMPRVAREFDALLAWMHRLEDTALDAVQGAWGIDELEAALAAMAPPDAAHASFDDRLGGVRGAVDRALRGDAGFVDITPLATRSDLAAVFSGEPSPAEIDARRPMPSMQGIAVWLADPPGRPQLLISTGLPGRDLFIRMFGGDDGASMRGPPAGAAERAPTPAAAVAAGTAADFDDPLATRPQPLDPLAPSIGAAGGDDDLLRMFDATPGVPTADIGQPRPQDDILALFGAEGASAEPPPAGAHGADGADGAKEPDILALFGVPPTEPDAGKTH
jgi:type VI secretion system protein ImpM